MGMILFIREEILVGYKNKELKYIKMWQEIFYKMTTDMFKDAKIKDILILEEFINKTIETLEKELKD